MPITKIRLLRGTGRTTVCTCVSLWPRVHMQCEEQVSNIPQPAPVVHGSVELADSVGDQAVGCWDATQLVVKLAPSARVAR
jgi:hypothetical protein